MTIRNIENLLKEILSDDAVKWHSLEDNRVDGIVPAGFLVPVVDVLNSIDDSYLVAITGLDNGRDDPTLDVLYHFCLAADVITLRVTINKECPDIDSICSIIPYASPLERETQEMFGINFIGTPDTSLLFLPDEQDMTCYPLRKDGLVNGVNDNGNG